MPINVQIQQLQTEIYEDLDQPSSISPSYIGSWLISNAGKINNLIGTSYSGVADSGIAPLLTEDELAITKMLFNNFWLQRQIKSNLGANGYTREASSISEGDSKVSFVTKTNVAQNLQVAQKQNYLELRDAVTAYRVKQAVPAQVVTP